MGKSPKLLLRQQANDVLQTLINVGLNPSEFEWQESKDECTLRHTLPRAQRIKWEAPGNGKENGLA
jgi:hypothetical protein